MNSSRHVSKRRIALVCGCAAAAVIGSAVFLNREHDRSRSTEYTQIESISRLKALQIERWRNETLADARAAAGGFMVSRAVRAWLESPARQSDLESDLRAWLLLQKGRALYADALLLGANGEILVSASAHSFASGAEALKTVQRAIAAGSEVLSDLYFGPDRNIYIDAIAPIKSDNGKVLGCVDLRANARSDLFALIQSWPTPSPTAETLMVSAEGNNVLFLNDLRHRGGTALTLRLPLSSTMTPAVQAVLGKQGLFEGRDYRDVPVLTDLRRIAGSPWFIVSKVDAAEVYGESRYRSLLGILIVCLVVLLAGAAIALVYRHNQASLYWNLLQAQRKEQEMGEELRTTLYSIGDAVISTDIGGAVRRMNPEAERLTGWTEPEARGRPLPEVFHILNEDSGAEVESPVPRVLREGAVVGLANHTMLISRDGTARPIADSGSPILDQKQTMIGVVLVFRDQAAERRARNALEASEGRYRSLVENLNVGIANVDQSETILFANPAAEAIFGVPRGALANRNLKDLLSADEFARVREESARRTADQESAFEISIRRPDGEERRLQVTAIAQRDSEGGLASALETIQDVTERRKAEEALVRQRALMQTLMDNVPDHIYFKDAQSRFILNNRSHVRSFGLRDPSELTGKTDFDFFTFEHASAAFEDEQRVIRTGQPIVGLEERETWPDRPDTWASTTKMPLHDERGNIIGTFGISRDITERRNMEARLQESEEHYRNTFMNAPFGVFHSTVEGKLLTVNQAFARMLGYDSPEEIREAVNSKSVAEVLYEDPTRRPAMVEEVITSGGWRRFSNRYRRKDGEIISAILTFRSFTPPGSAEELEGFVEDITERERAEQDRAKLRDQLQQAQKMEAVGRLAGGIAHDFNNILTAIYGYCDIGLARTPENEQAHNSFMQIKRASTRAANLTSQLLAFSRRRILEPRTINLGDLVAGMTDMLKRLLGEDIDVHAHLAEGLWSIRADPGQLEQVIMNLAVNSRDAMPDGGTLTIETANARLDQDYVREHAEVTEGEYAVLAISDTGHGMDAATQARIYEPFFTTKEVGKGTGLGLATVYGIVKQSGGYIYCYSEVGKGTTFKVYFPRWHGAEERGAEGAWRPATATRGTETILFVDDDEAIRTIIVAALQTAGYAVVSAGDGAEALRSASSLASPPDLLVTDVIMPGLSGSELARRLVERIPTLRVLYMSGYTENAIVHHGMLQEGIELLQKPFTTSDLLHRVRSMLDAARRQGSGNSAG